MAASNRRNPDVPTSTQLQLDVGDLKKDVAIINEKLDASSRKIDTVLDNMKGYVPVEIYKLHMEAQAKEDSDIRKEVEDVSKRVEVVENFININNTGIKFSNEIVANILKTLAYAAVAALILFAGYVIIKNGGSL